MIYWPIEDKDKKQLSNNNWHSTVIFFKKIDCIPARVWQCVTENDCLEQSSWLTSAVISQLKCHKIKWPTMRNWKKWYKTSLKSSGVWNQNPNDRFDCCHLLFFDTGKYSIVWVVTFSININVSHSQLVFVLFTMVGSHSDRSTHKFFRIFCFPSSSFFLSFLTQIFQSNGIVVDKILIWIW